MFRAFVISFFLSLPLSALTETEAFARFQKDELTAETLALVLPKLSAPEHRGLIRTKLLDPSKTPRAALVDSLSNPMLATRLGALEILEEIAGTDLSYNPWAAKDTPENQAALSRWKAWADKADPAAKSGSLFSDEQRRGYIRDILSDDADKAARSRHMLESEGLPAVGHLETFLRDTPTLGPGHRARIREAQYQITLSDQLGEQASVIARHLAFGSRDQLLSALSAIRPAGLLSLPILRDFISHPDSLVRETALDAFVATGGGEAVTIAAPLLKQEPDVNVIHGVMRRLKDVKGAATSDLVASFLTHPDEDLLISAIQTSLSLSGDTDPHANFSPNRKPAAQKVAADAPILKALEDKRWRVRAAALEYVAKRRLFDAKPNVINLLDDPDEFVRFAAIKAIGALNATEAIPKLDAMFERSEAMAGPVFEGYGALSRMPEAPLIKRLDQSSPDAKLAVLGVITASPALAPLSLHYVADENLDVACASIRFIARSGDTLKDPRYASAIAAALKSGTKEKIEAVLETLALPKSETGQAGAASLDLQIPAEPTKLDPLYDAFLLPGQESGNPSAPAVTGGIGEIIRELKLRITPDTDREIRYRAACHLAGTDSVDAMVILEKELPSYTTAQKIHIAEKLNNPSSPAAIPLLTALLRDPVPEVRSAAAEASVSNDSAKIFINLVLNELKRPGTPLKPHEVYTYHFESCVRSASNAMLFRNWAAATLKSDDASPGAKVLAIITLRSHTGTAVAELLRSQTDSPSTVVRRAAWAALLGMRPAEISSAADIIAANNDAFVRVVLPTLFNQGDSDWKHRFSDIDVVHDYRWTYNDKKPRLSETMKALLTRLATHDPSPLVRFESSFTLLTQGSTIDLRDFTALVPHLPKETDAAKRVTDWLEENVQRATPALRPLLSIIDLQHVNPENLAALREKIQPSSQGGFATFASLAKSTPESTGGELLAKETKSEEKIIRTSLEVVYFYKPGCPECVKAKQYLETVKSDFPTLKLHEHNILESAGTLFNQALCARFGVPSAKHTLSPAIFTQTGYIIRDDINPQSLAKLFAATSAVSQDDAWMDFGATEQQAASEEVDRRYAAFTLPVVIGAGLLDGINPCAFATIIFFLSYLQIARRTPREMLLTGIAFISAVFIAYLSAGLLLHQSLALLNDRFAGIQKWMNIGFAILALFAAFLSFRDAFRAKAGRIDEMTLQLPGFLKDRIRGVIRTSARARNFIVAAFISGLVVSLLELACTGQVYAPIIYQIQQGRLDAVLWLVIYNLAFITPLVVIFLLAYGGLRSESLIAFQKKHTFAVKLGLGLLFVVLAAFIFFGKYLLPH